MTYEFKGFAWTELAECWGIEAGERPLVKDSDGKDYLMVPEEIDVFYFINDTKMMFTTSDPEEVIAEKIKNYISEHMFGEKAEHQDRVRQEINRFLEALIKESKEHDFNSSAFRGILEIEDNITFSQWFCNNLETMWV